MTGKWAVALATGVLFEVVVISVVVVTGHYPRTGDTRVAVCAAVLIGAVAAVFGAARVVAFALLLSRSHLNGAE